MHNSIRVRKKKKLEFKQHGPKFNCQLAEEQLRTEGGSVKNIWSFCGTTT